MTGAGAIMVPTEQYQTIFKEITNKSSCIGKSCTLKTSLFQGLPDLVIKVDKDTIWKIGFEAYTYEKGTVNTLRFCDRIGCHYKSNTIFELTFVEGDSWGFGADALQYFYTILDFDSSTVGMLYTGLYIKKNMIAFAIIGTTFGALFLTFSIIMYTWKIKQ